MHTLIKSSIAILGTFGALSLFPSCTGESKVDNKETAAEAPAAGDLYTLQNQVFSLNLLSNISGHYNGKIAEEIKRLTVKDVKDVLDNKFVRNYIGNWQCVWGPVVHTPSYLPTKPMNTMFIAQNIDTPNLFVIAIAGTDPKSVATWGKENLDVKETTQWPYNNAPKGVAVSRGTWNGFSILSSMKDPSRKDTTALEFIKSRMNRFGSQPMRIYVTGHSLGGALSPTFALYLYDSLQRKGQPVSISCLAVAGATPGTAQFVQYYSAALGNTTTRVWNKLDVVPHGFEDDMLQQVDTIYKRDNIQTPDTIKLAIAGMRLLLKKIGYTQLAPATTIGFTSNYYNNNDRYDGDTANVETFGGQMLCQHIPAYANYFGVDSFQVGVQRVVKLQYPFFSEGLKPAGIANYGAKQEGVVKSR